MPQLTLGSGFDASSAQNFIEIDAKLFGIVASVHRSSPNAILLCRLAMTRRLTRAKGQNAPIFGSWLLEKILLKLQRVTIDDGLVFRAERATQPANPLDFDLVIAFGQGIFPHADSLRGQTTGSPPSSRRGRSFAL